MDGCTPESVLGLCAPPEADLEPEAPCAPPQGLSELEVGRGLIINQKFGNLETPLIPVCLLEKPNLTSDLKAENRKEGRAVWVQPHPQSQVPRGPKSPEVPSPPWAA